jgi:hypothetical protein
MEYPVSDYKPFLVLSLACTTCVVMGSCRGVSDRSGDAAGRAPPAGAAVVSNAETGEWTSGREWRLTEELHIGSANSGGPDMFGQIVGLEVDALGRLWVADAQEGEIRVFDASGRHVRTVGRKGGGPGEFAELDGMDQAPDGTLWVVDGGNARYTVLDTAGSIVATHPRLAGVNMAPWAGGFDAQGRLYDLVPLIASNGEIDLGLVRYGRNLVPEDTLGISTYESEYFELVSPDGTQHRTNVPFSPYMVWRVDRDGFVWSGVTDRYRLNRARFAADTVLVMERESPPVRITGAELDAMLENFKWFTDLGGKIDRRRIPRVKPPIFSLFFDDHGRPWVIPAGPAGEQTSFDVFEPSGRYLGRVASPLKVLFSPAPVVRGDYLYGVTQDEQGVNSVVRLRIERPT